MAHSKAHAKHLKKKTNFFKKHVRYSPRHLREANPENDNFEQEMKKMVDQMPYPIVTSTQIIEIVDKAMASYIKSQGHG